MYLHLDKWIAVFKLAIIKDGSLQNPINPRSSIEQIVASSYFCGYICRNISDDDLEFFSFSQ